MVTAERQDEIKLAHYLLERSLEQLTGRGEEFCYKDRPRNQYFIGSLANSPPQEEEDTENNDLFTRIAPSAMGLDVRIEPKTTDAQLVIQPHFAVYYRVFPNLDQQRKDSGYNRRISEERDRIVKEETHLSEWAIVYRKVDVAVPPLTITIPSNIAESNST